MVCLYSWVSLCTLVLLTVFFISAALFHCQKEHRCPIHGHVRSYCACQVSCARSIPKSPHHLHSVISFRFPSASLVSVQWVFRFRHFRCWRWFLRAKSRRIMSHLYVTNTKQNPVHTCNRKTVVLSIFSPSLSCYCSWRRRIYRVELISIRTRWRIFYPVMKIAFKLIEGEKSKWDKWITKTKLIKRINYESHYISINSQWNTELSTLLHKGINFSLILQKSTAYRFNPLCRNTIEIRQNYCNWMFWSRFSCGGQCETANSGSNRKNVISKLKTNLIKILDWLLLCGEP
jgi:hypothetical protein